jgi:hypothetical protein
MYDAQEYVKVPLPATPEVAFVEMVRRVSSPATKLKLTSEIAREKGTIGPACKTPMLFALHSVNHMSPSLVL